MMNKPRAAIVGAGAMGGLFGALLAESGVSVQLIDVNREQVEQINAGGLAVESAGAPDRKVLVGAALPEAVEPADLVLVMVKFPQTAEAAKTAKQAAGEAGLVLTLQNGMGAADILAETIEPRRVMAGATSHGATVLGAGRVRHAGMGKTTIGMWAGGDPGDARFAADLLTSAGIVTKAVEDVRPVIWHKLLINVGINAITALTGVLNGRLLELDQTRDLVRRAVLEASEAARESGAPVPEDIVDQVFEVARVTAANRSSMGQDVDARRPTEIEAINGYIVEAGRRLNIPTPVNFTLTALIRTMEAGF
jgi:2-dehydropantoate 2-reductase